MEHSLQQPLLNGAKTCVKHALGFCSVSLFKVIVAMVQASSPLALLLYAVELYHIFGHAAILFRLRLLPRRDLVRIRYYFLLDAASVFITCFLYTGRLKWLAALQIAQHLYYFMTWNQSWMANKIIDWSSLDYFKSPKKDQVELDSILGTAFDISVHVLNVYVLSDYLGQVALLLGTILAVVTAYFVLYNPRLAWSSPQRMPRWIERRISPLKACLEGQQL